MPEPVDCRHWQELFTDYLDGSLAADREAAFQAHIDECATCRSEVAAEQRLATIMANQLLKDPPRDFTERVLVRCKEEAASAVGSVSRARRLAVAYSIAAIILVIAVYQFANGPISTWQPESFPWTYVKWLAAMPSVVAQVFFVAVTSAVFWVLLFALGIYQLLIEDVL